MGILEKIAEIEREISRTQKNKGNGGQLGGLTVSCVIGEHVASCVYVKG